MKRAGDRLLSHGPGLGAAILVVVAVLAGGPAHAAPNACRQVGDPNFGPCMSPDPVSYFAPVGELPPVVVSNFGLLFPGPGQQWQYVCDDVFARPAPDRIRRSPNGDIFVPTTQGLLISRDGCTFSAATGDIATKLVYDVAVDAKNPQLVFALGNIPRTLWRSTDGGKSFTTIQTFPDGLLLFRVLVPPVRDKQVYLVGRGRGSSTPIEVSHDDGATFALLDPGLAAGPALKTSLDLLGADPRSPSTLYFNVIGPEGDALWRTTDGAMTVTPVLQLAEEEGIGGLAFGPPGTLYVGGANLFPDVTRPPGHLYISRDDGKTWLPPRATSGEGPQFSCLANVDGALYGCSTGQTAQDGFMVAVSRDEGLTWSASARLADLTGPRACAADQCRAVAQWLCDTYTRCAPGYEPAVDPIPPDAAAPNDAGVSNGPNDAGGKGPNDANADALSLPDEESACACRLAGPPKAYGSGTLAGVCGLLGLFVWRRASRSPRSRCRSR